MDNKDIDEIIYHIRKLRDKDPADSSSQKSEKANKKTTKTSMVSSNEDNKVQEVGEQMNKPVSNEEKVAKTISNLDEADPVSVMNPELVGWTDESTVTCDVCNEEIKLGKNLSGLVISDEFFACEDCCQKLSKEELMEWTQSKMVSSTEVRPIGLWVIEQQRENKKQETS
jgi:hypothetical protein